MLIQNFKGYVIENLDWSDRLEMIKLGISQESWSVLKCRVDWENVGQKKFDGTAQPFMKCFYYENWPHDLQTDDVWNEYPSQEITRRYLNDEGGEVELVDELMMRLAREHGADLLWVALDGDWYDVRTGEWIPAKLHRLI